MRNLYDVEGSKLLFSSMFWKEPLASVVCNSDLSSPHQYKWGEEISGGTETPFLSTKALYNGSACQADCRILTYEDGSPIINDNKVYFSMSTQIAMGSPGAIVCEHELGTSNLRMTGCIVAYYDGAKFTATGNHIMYNRENGKWFLYTHSQNNKGHRLLVSESISDPRFGVSNVYYNALDYQNPASGDEDQFVFYSDEIDKWVMIYVAIRNNDANYILRMHTSDYCDHGFTFYGEVNNSSVLRATGLIATKVGGTRYILSGSSATGVNKNLIYSFPDLTYVGEINLDYGTGANKGTWPTLFPITDGKNTKYYFFTFDRSALVPSNVWSYGCLYMYCAKETNAGMEFPVKRDGKTLYEAVTPTYDITDLHFKRKWSLRNAMDLEFKLSEIKLEQAILYDQSNMYPKIGSIDVVQDETGLYLEEAGSAIIVGGEHEPFAAYVLTDKDIKDTDRRSIVILDSNNAVKLRVSITKDGKVYGHNGSTETLLGTKREESNQLIICTGWSTVLIFEK